MTVEALGPRDVQTTLNFYLALDDEPPFNILRPAPGVKKTNVGTDTRPMVIHDARGNNDLGLDVSGFQFIHAPSICVEEDFLDEEKIKTVYYQEAGEILKKYTGAKRVHIFNHIVRWGSEKHGPTRPSIHHAHIDQTTEAAIARVKQNLGDDAERLLKGRWRIMNLWRPITNPVAHTPIAVCDFRTLDPEKDLVPTRQINVGHEGSLFNVKHNPGHRWYYLSDQSPEEVAVFKCFDSDFSKPRFAPHSAFKDPTSPPDAPQRQSLDVRALVFDLE